MAIHEAYNYQEWSAMATSAVLDKVASNFSNSTSANPINTGTTAAAGFTGTSLSIAVGCNFKNETSYSAQTAGYTTETATDGSNIAMEFGYQSLAVVSGVTTENFQATANSAGKFAACIASFVGSGTPALVHETAATAGGLADANTGQNSASGNLLVIALGFDQQNYAYEVFDDKGQMWFKAVEANNTTGGGQVSIWYFPNTVSGVGTVSFRTRTAPRFLVTGQAVQRAAVR